VDIGVIAGKNELSLCGNFVFNLLLPVVENLRVGLTLPFKKLLKGTQNYRMQLHPAEQIVGISF